jgi:RNA methyltransferase, trmH family
MDGLYYFMRKLRTIEMNRLSLEEFKEADKLPLIVVLDDVRSLHNVGSVFRSADAFRVEAVYLCGITATPPNAEIHKTALGGEDSVDWRYFERTEDAIEELHRQGVFVYSVEQVEGSTKLQDLNTQHPINTQHPTPHYAIVLGNEVKGVKQSVVDMSDGCLEIPQFGTKHSLNVSVTTGIVIWEFARQLLLK